MNCKTHSAIPTDRLSTYQSLRPSTISNHQHQQLFLLSTTQITAATEQMGGGESGRLLSQVFNGKPLTVPEKLKMQRKYHSAALTHNLKTKMTSLHHSGNKKNSPKALLNRKGNALTAEDRTGEPRGKVRKRY